MRDLLISGDNHIDLTYCPPDLWSSQAPSKWKLLAPRVEELEDGLHWFVEAQDKGMWNGVGPGFLKYQQGMFGHIELLQPTDASKPVGKFLAKHGEGVYLVGFECGDIPGAVKDLRDKGVKVDARRDDIAWLHPREAHGLFVELRKRERYG